LYENNFSEARVLQVERKSVLKPDQAEFVLSEGIVNQLYKIQFTLAQINILIKYPLKNSKN